MKEERLFFAGGAECARKALLTRRKHGCFGLTLAARNEERGANVCARLGELGCKAIFVPAELSCVDDVRKIVPRHQEVFGRLDGLVNSAGDTGRGHIRDMPVEDFDRIYAVNVRAHFLLMQAASNAMREQGRDGSIVNILTMESHGGRPRIAAYASSKAALATLTKNAAHALRCDRINVNGIQMGQSPTPHEHINMTAAGAPEDWAERTAEKIPFKKLVDPQEVGALAAFLLSAEAGVMTGSLVDFAQEIPGTHD